MGVGVGVGVRVCACECVISLCICLFVKCTYLTYLKKRVGSVTISSSYEHMLVYVWYSIYGTLANYVHYCIVILTT